MGQAGFHIVCTASMNSVLGDNAKGVGKEQKTGTFSQYRSEIQFNESSFPSCILFKRE